MTYPLFEPPQELRGKEYRAWTSAQAESYFQWLMSVWQERVVGLLDCAGGEQQSGEALLVQVDAWVLEHLGSSDFSNGQLLSAQGRALAADFGLLFARELISACSNVSWSIGRGPKTDVAFNLPVLVGFGSASLDPIRAGISHYGWMVAGNQPRHGWPQIFKYWLERAGGS